MEKRKKTPAHRIKVSNWDPKTLNHIESLCCVQSFRIKWLLKNGLWWLSKILNTPLMIHSFVKHCWSQVGENSCLVFSVRLGTAAIILAHYATDWQMSRVTWPTLWAGYTQLIHSTFIWQWSLYRGPVETWGQNVSWCDLKPHLVWYKHFWICTGQSKISVHNGILWNSCL